MTLTDISAKNPLKVQAKLTAHENAIHCDS